MPERGGGTQLRARLEGNTLWLTLDGERVRNALDADVYAALTRELDLAEQDDSVRTIALTGRGTAFCAGMNLTSISARRDADDPEVYREVLHGANTLQRLRDVTKPTIAVVNGAAVGAGVALIAACDVAVADADAHFSVPEVRFGLLPGVVTPLLIEAIGFREAKRRLLVGDRFGAAEAQRIGLIHAIGAGREQILELARDFISQLESGGPRALAMTKEFLGTSRGVVAVSADLPGIAAKVAEARSSAEVGEAILARMEKRSVTW